MTKNGSEIYQLGYKDGRESVLVNVGMLRQWINERPAGYKLLTNEDIIHFLTL